MTGNEKKRELLGMPFGTASGQLRKKLLYFLAQKCNLDTCYRCSSKINSIDEFSIEHKKAWASAVNPKEAFFDLDNIAFSHISCNVGAASKTNKKYESEKERKKEQFRRYYSKPDTRTQLLERKRDRHHKNK